MEPQTQNPKVPPTLTEWFPQDAECDYVDDGAIAEDEAENARDGIDCGEAA